MSYNLEFRESAWKEWQKLDPLLREQFKSKLLERLESPCMESARLSGPPDCYKIKLRAAGYRLVYTGRGSFLRNFERLEIRCE